MNKSVSLFFIFLLLTSDKLFAVPALSQQTSPVVTKTATASTTAVDEEEQALLQKQTELRNRHFQNIDELVSLYAPGLALKYLQREQPSYSADNPADWLFWEQKQISLLKYMRQWQQLDDRINSQATNLANFKVATADRNWFLTEQLRALVELKNYTEAIDKTRSLLWNASSLVSTDTLATWRRIIIQIYVSQGLEKDARTAMRRYQQDYGELQNEDGVSWLQLQAELLIQSAHYNEAIVILKKITTDEAQAVILLAMLKAKNISAVDALDSALLILKSTKDDAENKSLYQYVALVASIAADNTSQSINLLEKLLATPGLSISDSLQKIAGININADTLWDLYLSKGTKIANKNGLLKGDDTAWYAYANNLLKKKPLTAKTLLAVLSLQAQEPQQRELAMKQLVNLLEAKEPQLQLINSLFTASKYFVNLNHVPAEVRYRLVDYNLSLGNVKAAALLMADLQKPPENQQQSDWNLRRARVLILSGGFEQGAKLLHQMLETKSLEKGLVDKYLQVVFDLQAVEQHELSLALFNQLQQLVVDPHVQREITFWKAESYYSLKQYDQAAYLFLKSAVSPDKVFDPWYQTATFRAAESLLSAGLYDDARQRFQYLLKITENAARKSVIRQRLQAIQLKQQVR